MRRVANAWARRFRYGLLLPLSLLASCATAPDRDAHWDSLPPGHRIVGLPFFPQVEDQCGPSSLATMLAARDVHVDPGTLRGALYIPGKSGTVTTEIVARARRYGLLVYPLQPDLTPLLQEIAAGNPVLVLQNLGFDWAPRWHFSVITGYDRENRYVVLGSGTLPDREVGIDLFDKTWRRADRWAVVMLAPDRLPATATEQTWVRAAADLEQVGQLQAAAIAYDTALGRWPRSAVALFGAGNVAYASGDYRRARDAFAAYLEVGPGAAAGWNNLAYSLLQLGCREQSLRAVQCAGRLAPDDPAYRDSHVELQHHEAVSPANDCSAPVCPLP